MLGDTTTMTQKAPGKWQREGVSLVELMDMFPTEESARLWLEAQVWPDGEPVCPFCGSPDWAMLTPTARPLRYWCGGCREHFSVRTGTALHRSRVSLRKWVFAIYLEATNLKGVSSMKLHRDLGVTQKTAWFMLHRIREWGMAETAKFTGPVEFDETYVGGRRKNMPKAKRARLTGRGPVDRVIVAGAKDRASNQVSAEVVPNVESLTLKTFVREHAVPGAAIYTDGAVNYQRMPEFQHESVNHHIQEYVRGDVHTNGIESFWSMFKRAYIGTFHHLSAKHLGRYVAEFAGSHNMREMGTLRQMGHVARGLVGRRIQYRDLTA